MNITRTGYVGMVVAMISIVIIPYMANGQWVKILTSTVCFTLAASGIAFMYSRLNMVSLAQVGQMAVGGWIMLRMNHWLDLPFEFNLLIAATVTALFGIVLALPALRMRGLYLALITLMAAGGLEVILSTFRFPNGGEGFWGVMPSVAAPFRRPIIATSDSAYLSYAVAVTTLGFLLIEWHRNSVPGRAWAMIRRSEAAAMASGVNVTFYKAWAFALSGMLAGLAGGLLAGSLGLLDPSTFRASESILLFALCVVGGSRFWLGAVIAGILYRVLPALFNDWRLDADLALIIFGAALLHAIITAPDGLAGQFMALFAKPDGGKLDRA